MKSRIFNSRNVRRLTMVGAVLLAMSALAAEPVPEIVSREAIFWLDAADEATISRDGSGAVSTWRSKSGDGRVATSTAARPLYDTTTYGFPVVDFGTPGSGKDFRYPRIEGIRSPEEKPFATMTGAELAEKGFRVEFANRQDGELFEIRCQTGR